MFSQSSKRVYSVRMEGLEPPCLAALDPKSSASTNFATSALVKKNFRRLFSELECKFRNKLLSFNTSD